MRSPITLIVASLCILHATLAAPVELEERACSAPDVNSATVKLVKKFESFSARPYDDVGQTAIGYGHMCKAKGCKDLSPPITKREATKILTKDLKSAQNGLASALKSSVKLNANQYGALVSWGYNTGLGNVKSSTLVKRLNNGESPAKVIRQELPKWRKGPDGVLQGLVKRRKDEVKLARTKTSKKALPC